MHIFLTGEIQVGKSTIIRSFLERTGLTHDGFMTFWQDENNARSLYLSEYSSGLRPLARFLLAQDIGKQFVREKRISEIFDIRGSEILRNSGKCKLLIMDELGHLESNANEFKKTVLECLNGQQPILGVIKKKRTEFLDAVRAHPKVDMINITEQNRDAVLEKLLENHRR
jgi:nucleoside-triphosphatase